MNHVERFRAIMNFQPIDRMPVWEWAMWWDLTIERWRKEGLPAELTSVFDIGQYFGLDPYQQFWFSTTDPTIEAVQHHVMGEVRTMDDYLAMRPRLFPDHSAAIEVMRPWAARQAKGDAVVWATLEGFFWFPRTLMGMEQLCYAFGEQPELIHAMNTDLLEFNLRLLRQMSKACIPTFMTLAEDMSYNNGPMIGEEMFDEFLAPYYLKLMEELNEHNIMLIVDTDGDVTKMVPWLQRVGVAGVLPLERQAGVDGMKLREQYPELRMIGHYDKMVMHRGEDAIRAEFDRLAPIVRRGGFIASVDHQTPPAVSMEEYRVFVRLLKEFAVEAAPAGKAVAL